MQVAQVTKQMACANDALGASKKPSVWLQNAFQRSACPVARKELCYFWKIFGRQSRGLRPGPIGTKQENEFLSAHQLKFGEIAGLKVSLTVLCSIIYYCLERGGHWRLRTMRRFDFCKRFWSRCKEFESNPGFALTEADIHVSADVLQYVIPKRDILKVAKQLYKTSKTLR